MQHLTDTETFLKQLPISRRTLAIWREKHLIEYVQVGRKCFYKQSEIERIIDQFTVPAVKGGLR